MTKIPKNVEEALIRFGFSQKDLGKFSGSSKLIHDIGIWGDDLDEFHDVLCEIYGTENKIDAKYWAGEFSWMRQPLLWLPFVSHKKNLACEPLSLNELDRIMSA
ncbi:MAG: hypothetical protein ACRBBV_03045 [Paracoccaceae bacterium]